MTIYCNLCGSTEVEVARWTDANTGALGDPTDCPDTGAFCRDCDGPCVPLDDTDPGDAATLAKRRGLFEQTRSVPEDPYAAALDRVLSAPPEQREAALRAESDAFDACECDEDVIPGACFPFNEQAEVQRCDLCKRFECDEDAGQAVARALNEAVALDIVPAGVYTSAVLDEGTPNGRAALLRDGVELDYNQAAHAHTALWGARCGALPAQRVIGRLVAAIHDAEIAGHFERQLLLDADDLAKR